MSADMATLVGSFNHVYRQALAPGSGGKSAHILYLGKSINTAILKYSVTSESPEFNIYLSESRKVESTP